MNNPTTELRLLSTLRAPQHQHVVWRIKPELFTDERQEVFEALQIALRKYGNASTEAIEATLQRELPHALDVPYVGDPAPLIDDLARLYRKRIAAELSSESKRLASTHDPDLAALRDLFTKAVYVHEEDSRLDTGINQFLTSFHAKESGSYRWIDTGLMFLNNMLGGEWPRGELTIISGQTGGGKTALMNTSALHMARLHKETGKASPPGIFSIEMPKEQLVTRFLSDLTGIPSTYLRMGAYPDRAFNPAERQEIERAVNELKSLPLYVFDTPSIDANWIVAQAKELHRKHGVEIFFIDYLQLLRFDGENKHYGLGDSGKALTRFAKSHNVAVVALAQVNNEGKIRDTGDTDKDAGAWIHISLDRDGADDRGICPAQFEVLKNRHGPTGKYTGLYDLKHVKFVE